MKALSSIFMHRNIRIVPIIMYIQFTHVPIPIERIREPEAPRKHALKMSESIFCPLSLKPGSSGFIDFSPAVSQEMTIVEMAEKETPQTIGSGSFMLTVTTAVTAPTNMPVMSPFAVAFFQNMQLIRGKNIAEE